MIFYPPDYYMTAAERHLYLVTQYYAGTATAAETRELSDLLQQEEHRAMIVQHLETLAATTPASDHITDAQLEAGLQAILPVTHTRVVPMRRYWTGVAAAVLLLAITGSSYYLFQQQRRAAIARQQSNTTEIAPGHDGAILTLANGKKIVLDSAGNGVIAAQGNNAVIKNNGQLIYQGDATDTAASLMNTLTTPRGRQFALVLPDGSKVWLNAASSIRFPAAFRPSERTVAVNGEAYFEVAKVNDAQGKRIPFKVNINQHATVEVLGTHFNINAYTDENSIRTTLLEGSVKMTDGRQSALLAPGEQAILSAQHITLNRSADIAEATAWKNGTFTFNGRTDLAEVMLQLSRWYDVEIIYEGKVPDISFTGEMQRGLSLQQVTSGFSSMGVHFKIEGRKIIIQP